MSMAKKKISFSIFAPLPFIFYLFLISFTLYLQSQLAMEMSNKKNHKKKRKEKQQQQPSAKNEYNQKSEENTLFVNAQVERLLRKEFIYQAG